MYTTYLRLIHVNEEMQGNYQCGFTNEYGSDYSDMAELQVIGKMPYLLAIHFLSSTSFCGLSSIGKCLRFQYFHHLQIHHLTLWWRRDMMLICCAKQQAPRLHSFHGVRMAVRTSQLPGSAAFRWTPTIWTSSSSRMSSGMTAEYITAMPPMLPAAWSAMLHSA